MVRRRLLYGTLPELCDTLRVVLPSCVTTFIIFVPSEVMATGGDHDRLRVTVWRKGSKLMEKGSNRVFYRTDVTFDESNFKLTEEKPVTEGRRIDETTVEVDVGCSFGWDH